MLSQISSGLDHPGPPIILLHGFSQGAWLWEPYLEEMSNALSAPVIAVDCPGHGGSTDLLITGEEFSELLLGFGRIHLVGYSMGARLAMVHAARHPEVIQSIVIISGHPGFESKKHRRQRQASDAVLAERLLRCEVPGDEALTRSRFGQFLDWWTSRPIFGHLGEKETRSELRLLNSPSSLASTLELFGTGVQKPVWAEIAQLPAPLMFIAGEMDLSYVEIGRSLMVRRLAETNHPSIMQIVPLAYHAVVSQAPDVTISAIKEFVLSSGEIT